MADDTTNKTLEATPEKLRKARKEGQFARSRDAGSVAATVGVLLVTYAAGSWMTGMLGALARSCFGAAGAIAYGQRQELLQSWAATTIALIVPPALTAAIAATAVGFVQAGWQPYLEILQPKLSRINPMGRLKSMLTLGGGGVELGMTLLRVGVVGIIAWQSVKQSLPELMLLADADIHGSIARIASLMGQLAIRATVALAVLAAVDYVYARYKLRKDLMMSVQELKEEHKQQEGDPAVKSRLRQRMREMTRHALAVQVGRADVLVTNPTHVAVALRYRQTEAAPVVTARGYDEVALYMRKLAREAGVPIVENRPLARMLAAKVKPGQMVPVELYAAVAEVLAFVYRLRRRMHPAPAAGSV
jgi:flagellar biosynthetic protein FlhB